MIPIIENVVNDVGCYRGKSLSLISEVSFLGGIAIAAHGLSKVVNDTEKRNGALQIFEGISIILISSYIESVSKEPKPSHCK